MLRLPFSRFRGNAPIIFTVGVLHDGDGRSDKPQLVILADSSAGINCAPSEIFDEGFRSWLVT
jgi:hypothetical protein